MKRKRYKNAHLVGFPELQSLPKTPCKHQGETIRLVECPTCKGRVMIKVLACAVHIECSVMRRVDGVVGCCSECADYVAG